MAATAWKLLGSKNGLHIPIPRPRKPLVSNQNRHIKFSSKSKKMLGSKNGLHIRKQHPHKPLLSKKKLTRKILEEKKKKKKLSKTLRKSGNF